jgi:Zn-dependent metalloprotease
MKEVVMGMKSSSRFKIQISITAILLFGASLGIQAAFQAEVPGKIKIAESFERQFEGQPAAEVAAYWQEFSARNNTPMAITWSPVTGTAQAIYGQLSEPMGVISEVSARRFLSENAQLFKLSGDLNDLSLVRSFESPMGRHFVFDQNYQGVPVYGAETSVHFNQEGRVVALNNSYLPNINVNVKPSVSLEGALDIARLELPGSDLSEAGSNLVIYAFNNSYSLAWNVVVPTSRRTWEIFIDAHSGAVLGNPRDINRYVTGTGQVYKVNAIVATRDNSLRDNNDAASAVPSSAYMTVTLQGLVGNGFLDGEFASSSKTRKRASSPTNEFIFDRSSDGFSETMTYYYIDYAERYIQSLGFSNVNNRQQVFTVNSYKKDNSFYSPGSKEISLGTGGVDDAEDAEVSVHEYGHSIQDNQKPGFGSTREAGSMGEGFGDYWAASVGAQFSGGFQDTCFSEWDATSYSSTNPPCLRRLDSTKHYPESIVGEIHADGEMWSAALWQIRGALGAAKADKLVLTHHFIITTGASFNEASNALLTTASSLGFSTTEVSSIRTILKNRGFIQ